MSTDYPGETVKKTVAQEALDLLCRNRRTGTTAIDEQEFDYFYTCPSAAKYPHQWLWDSCFHAIVLSRFDGESAQKELLSLLRGIRPSGRVPNMILWDSPQSLPERLATRLFVSGITSNITQPPVLATALEEVTRNTQDLNFVAQCLPAVKSYYNWLETARDPDGDGLVSVIHPWETGTDASPVFDSLLQVRGTTLLALQVYAGLYGLLFKYCRLGWDEQRILASKAFDVEHAMFNCIYAEGLRAIARLSDMVGAPADAQLYAARAERVEEAVLAILWDEESGAFVDLFHPGHRRVQIKTISSLFPLILDTLPAPIAAKLVKHLRDESEFWVSFPVPSVSRGELAFDPDYGPLLWRGPTWINVNWFIVRGLLKHGYGDIAREIARRSVALVDRGGFREFFNPLTGEGEGQRDFGWSTLVVDMMDCL